MNATPPAAIGPIDWSQDGFFRLHDDGRLEPVNQAARELLAGGFSGTTSFATLPLPQESVDLLHAGGAVPTVVPGGGTFVLRLRTDAAAGRWLQASDVTVIDDLQGQLAALQRLRLLAGFAQGIVHDLNNVLGAAIGIAERAQDTGGEDHALVQGLLVSARNGAQVLRTFARLTRASPRERRVADLAALAGDALSLFGKSAQKHGCAVELQVVATPRVRVVVEDAMQLVLLVCVMALASTTGGVQTLVVDEARNEPDGQRPVGRIRLLDRGPLAVFAGLDSALTRPQDGVESQFAGLPGDGSDLLQAVLAHLRHGGHCAVGAAADGRRELMLAWPAVVR